jgi:hypothetical protein
MADLRSKIKNVFILGFALVLLVGVFALSIIQKSYEGDASWLNVVRDIFIIGAFGLLYLFFESLWKREANPAKKLGFALVVALVVGVASVAMSFAPSSGFDLKSGVLIPLGYDSIFWANAFGIVVGVIHLLMFMLIRDIIFSKRRKGTRRNFILLLVPMSANILLLLVLRPEESTVLTSVVYGLAIAAMVLNSFRLTWIVHLSKREKVFSIIYGFLLFAIFIGFDIITSGSGAIARSIQFYSPVLNTFISSVALFATIYFGMTFISMLFHLPTAEAFDRKISEVSSLHNLSRLVTQVMDFNELVDSVTTMTLDVCEAQSAWLEIIRVIAPTPAAKMQIGGELRGEEVIQVVANKNISREDVDAIVTSNGNSLRNLVLDSRKFIVVDEVRSDKRTVHLKDVTKKFNSLAIVPLLSQDRVIGILYAAKDMEFGFDQDDVEVISAFADQATIAIENSRSSRNPWSANGLCARCSSRRICSENSFHRMFRCLRSWKSKRSPLRRSKWRGLLRLYHGRRASSRDSCRDVSGKGVSAAFYMAGDEGIFRSLSRIYRSPRNFSPGARDPCGDDRQALVYQSHLCRHRPPLRHDASPGPGMSPLHVANGRGR